MKFCVVLSTRPEIIKLSPFINVLKNKKDNFYLINTNQHSLKNMSKVFFNFFNIKTKIYNLWPSKKSQFIFLSESIRMISTILKKKKPDYLVVQGDTNTSLAGCLAASLLNRNLSSKEKIKIVHIESGLRSFDDTMPEEINRKIIDELSNILFVPTQFDLKNLVNENCIKNKDVYVVGNTISDVLKEYLPKCSKSTILKQLKIKQDNFFLVTVHRPESVDNKKNLLKLSNIFNHILKKYNFPIIFPIHPRTRSKLKKFGIKFNKKIKIIDPLEYLDFLKLVKSSKILLTDSGGLQEESSIIGVPCITLRDTTERQITMIKKVNRLAGYKKSKVISSINYFMKKKISKIKDFGTGKVSVKIYNKLLQIDKKN